MRLTKQPPPWVSEFLARDLEGVSLYSAEKSNNLLTTGFVDWWVVLIGRDEALLGLWEWCLAQGAWPEGAALAKIEVLAPRLSLHWRRPPTEDEKVAIGQAQSIKEWMELWS